MRIVLAQISLFCMFLLTACAWPGEATGDNILDTYEVDTIGTIENTPVSPPFRNTGPNTVIKPDSPVVNAIDTLQQKALLAQWGKTFPAGDVVAFAKTLMGTPYVYASTDPNVGFDCSGFITYVFNHFGFSVPRSSVEFTNRGVEVPVRNAAPGDLILFTGTDTLSRIVGHMGIVIDNSDSLRFIHSSSGKAMGVTVSPLQGYYQKRFVKVISVKDGI